MPKKKIKKVVRFVRYVENKHPICTVGDELTNLFAVDSWSNFKMAFNALKSFQKIAKVTCTIETDYQE